MKGRHPPHNWFMSSTAQCRASDCASLWMQDDKAGMSFLQQGLEFQGQRWDGGGQTVSRSTHMSPFHQQTLLLCFKDILVWSWRVCPAFWAVFLYLCMLDNWTIWSLVQSSIVNWTVLVVKIGLIYKKNWRKNSVTDAFCYFIYIFCFILFYY